MYGLKQQKNAKAKAAYRQKYESDFIIADAAARYFRENGISKLPSYKALQALRNRKQRFRFLFLRWGAFWSQAEKQLFLRFARFCGGKNLESAVFLEMLPGYAIIKSLSCFCR